MPEKHLLYRWPDGSTAELEVREMMSSSFAVQMGASPTVFQPRIIVRQPGRKDAAYLQVERLIRSRSPDIFQHVFSLSSHDKTVVERINGPFRRKLLGLCVDIGVDRPSEWSSGLLRTGTLRTQLKFPKFVDDDRYEGRYAEAERYLIKLRDPIPKIGRYLGCVQAFRVVFSKTRGTYDAAWDYDDLPPAHHSRTSAAKQSGFSSFREAVDAALSMEQILPLSQREAWLEENADRGELVLLSQEEMELYRMLGEAIPLFWAPERLVEWLAERRGLTG